MLCYRELQAVVLKKSHGNFTGQVFVAVDVQLARVRAKVAVLHSRVTDISFPVVTRAEFYNTIGQKRTSTNK